ncbi:MAG: hypothetical protein K940chlam7_00205 [Chlamydiae bacterium]|nr:hypothetical protein [Chlamydiota bacterium]
MKPGTFYLLFSILTVAFLCTANTARASNSAESIEYQMKVQRACEVAIWALPAVSIYDIELSIRRDLSGKFGDVAYLTKPMTSRHGFLTANDVTPYVFSGQSCKDDPLVVEVPPSSEKATFFGSFVDAWQAPIVDVGARGADKGKGGKYLFLPPDYKGDVPDGYLVYRPYSYGVHFAFRPVAKNGGTNEDQVALARSLKVYRLSQAANPPKTTFIDAYPEKLVTLPVYDWTYFTDLNTFIQREPILERDKAMMALLTTLGIEKGKEFKPDNETKKAMLEGLECAYNFLQHRFVTEGGALVRFWKDRQWGVFNLPPEQVKLGFPFVQSDRVLSDERAQYYFYGTYLPVSLGGSTFYLGGLRDKNGELLNGTDTYRLRVSADTPAKDFWSVIVYSMKTKGFMEGVDRVGLSSAQIEKMKKNDDGSVDVYFAPRAPSGMESNWIPTGEDFFLLFRLYGPDKPLFDKTWRLGDVEKMKQEGDTVSRNKKKES